MAEERVTIISSWDRLTETILESVATKYSDLPDPPSEDVTVEEIWRALSTVLNDFGATGSR